MSEDLSGFLFNSISEAPKKTNNALRVYLEALSNPNVPVDVVNDPMHLSVDQIQSQQQTSYSVPTKSFDDIAHPERAGLAARQRKIDQERQYAEDIANLPVEEIENLCDLIKRTERGDRVVIDSKTIKNLAENEGFVFATENLERLGLIKRDAIQDDSGWLIDFSVTREGKRIYSILKQYFQNRLGQR